jgi:hypothetical protein
MITKDEFISLLQNRLWPVLKAQGFTRRGFVYHRFRGVVTNALRLEASNVTRNIRVNLGVHLAFLPTLEHDLRTPKYVEPAVCAFQQKLGMDDRQTNPKDWSFGADAAETKQAVADVIRTYETTGTAFFDRWSRFPQDFLPIGADGIDAAYMLPFRYPSTVFERATVLAHLHAHLGDVERADAFARRGLEDAPAPDPRRSRLTGFLREG